MTTATSSMLHACSRVTGQAAFLSLLGPAMLYVWLHSSSAGGALLVSLAGLLPAVAASVLFLLAACAYSMARDAANGWRAMLTILACGSLFCGALAWVSFFHIATV